MTRDSVLSRPRLWGSVAGSGVPSFFTLAVACRLWLGHEGHAVVGLIAEHYMAGTALTKASDLLGGSSIDGVASWADDYRHDHPETGPWHYIDIPLADSKIDLARE